MAKDGKETITVKYRDIYLICVGYFTSRCPGDYHTAPSPAEFEAHKILVEDTDIMDLLDYQLIEEIEQQAVESIEDN